MPELRGQLGFVNVLKPRRVVRGVPPLEFLYRVGKCQVTTSFVPEPGKRTRLHQMEMRGERRGGDLGSPRPRGACKRGRLAEPADVRGLMAHRVQDACAEEPVVTCLRECQGLDEVSLSEAARRRAVVAHPCREKRGLAYRGEQFSPDRLGIPATQKALAIGAEVLNEGLARMTAPELVVKLREHLDRHPEPVHVRNPYMHAVPVVAVQMCTGIYQPAN